MPFRWRLCEITGWRPEAREGATLTRLRVQTRAGTEERAYLFGGLSRELYSAVDCLAHDSQGGFHWTHQSFSEPNKRRYGHAACAWEDRMLVVGGARMYSREAKHRECMSDVISYTPVSDEWTEIVPEGTPFEARRYHSVCMVGSQLVLYGGINGQQTYLADLQSLNIGRPNEKRSELAGRLCRWAQVYTRGRRPGPLAYHSCQLVVHPERLRGQGTLSLSSLPDCRPSKIKVSFSQHKNVGRVRGPLFLRRKGRARTQEQALHTKDRTEAVRMGGAEHGGQTADGEIRAQRELLSGPEHHGPLRRAERRQLHQHGRIVPERRVDIDAGQTEVGAVGQGGQGICAGPSLLPLFGQLRQRGAHFRRTGRGQLLQGGRLRAGDGRVHDKKSAGETPLHEWTEPIRYGGCREDP